MTIRSPFGRPLLIVQAREWDYAKDVYTHITVTLDCAQIVSIEFRDKDAQIVTTGLEQDGNGRLRELRYVVDGADAEALALYFGPEESVDR